MMDGTPSNTAPDSSNSESTIGKVFDWIGNEAHAVWEALSAEEALLIQKFGPLFQQIEAQAEALGKETLSAGINALFDAANSAVAAAATAGTNKVQAAESAFLTTVSSEGITAVNNASAGIIKAAVADLQSAQSIAQGSAPAAGAAPTTGPTT